MYIKNRQLPYQLSSRWALRNAQFNVLACMEKNLAACRQVWDSFLANVH